MEVAESLGSLASSLLESEDDQEEVVVVEVEEEEEELLLLRESFAAPKVMTSGMPQAAPDACSRKEPRTSPGATMKKSGSFRNLCLRKTPDFSKVLPRVRVPKDAKPVVSRRSSSRESPSPELHLNPADYVKEALLNAADVVSNPRVQKTIITLVERLQEDYSKLLIKHAEAENTIDRLRFGAKVNLFSEPPKPSCSVPSELSLNASRSMTLDFPQAQRPQLGSASPQTNGHDAEPSLFCVDSSPLGLNMGQHAAQTLHNQAAKFLQQLLAFDDVLKTKTLPPFQQMKGLLQLFEELNSLEMGYLLARDEHKLQQQQSGDDVTFDCQRDLEEQIHQFRLHAEELKEQVEQTLYNKPASSPPPPPSSPPQPSPSYVHSEVEETQRQPRISPLSAAAAESDAQESPVHSCSSSSNNSSPRWSCASFSPSHGAAAAAAAQSPSSPSVHRQHHHVWAELRKSNSSSLSSLGECGEIPAPETSESKVQPGSGRTAPPQDGLISPEMDSGFVGSESSRVTPAAVHSPLHQMASQRDLEQLICHARLCTKNLMEMMEGNIQEESACETPPTAPPPPHPPHPPQSTPPSSALPSEGEEARRISQVLRLPPPPPPYASLKVGPVKTESDFQESDVQESSVRSNPPSRRSSVHSTSLFTHPHFHPHPHHHPQHHPHPRHLQSSETRESPSRSRSRHQMASRRSDERSWSDDFGEIRQTSWTPLKTSSVVRPKTPQSRRFSAAENSHSDHFTKSFNSLYSSRLSPSHLSSSHRSPSHLSSSHLSPSHLSSSLPAPHHYGGGDNPRATGFRQVANHRREERSSSDEFNELRRSARTPPKETQAVGEKAPQHRRASKPGKPRLAVSFLKPSMSSSSSSSQSQPQTTNRLHSSPPLPPPPPPAAAPADETDSRNHRAPPYCLECSARQRGRSERQDGGNRTSSSSSSSSSSSCCPRCPRCGRLRPHRDADPDSRRRSESRSRCQTDESPDRATRSRRAVAPPPLPQCMIVGQPLLVYPLPVHLSPSNSPGASPGVVGGRGTRRSSPPLDQLISLDSSLDSSLDRAIRAARRMRHTSRHMAHSQAQGLHYQKLLSHS